MVHFKVMKGRYYAYDGNVYLGPAGKPSDSAEKLNYYRRKYAGKIFTKEEQELAENLHNWYLQATKKLKPKDYNPNAQKKYSELTKNQKFIDLFIARKIIGGRPKCL